MADDEWPMANLATERLAFVWVANVTLGAEIGPFDRFASARSPRETPPVASRCRLDQGGQFPLRSARGPTGGCDGLYSASGTSTRNKVPCPGAV